MSNRLVQFIQRTLQKLPYVSAAKPDYTLAVIPREQHSVSRQLISENALKVLRRLNASGYDAYLVGGGVRDILLGRRPKDFDIATNAKPEEIAAIFRNCRLIGRRFRLAHIFFGHDIIEVATFRADHRYGGKKHAQTKSGVIVRDNVYGNIEDDAFRRDFTVNALYYNIADFSVVDFTEGLADLEARQLRMIGDPKQRYREDPVRMLRAIRLSAKLDLTIEEKTAAPIKSSIDLIDVVSNARLFEEFQKLFLGGAALKTYQLLTDYGFFAKLFPFTHEALQSDDGEQVKLLIEQTFINTDQRIAAGKPVMPAFLLASLLWHPLQKLAEQHREQFPPVPALDRAARELLQQQAKIVTIPKRFSLAIRDIWMLQHRLHRRLGGSAQRILSHPRFRAAYDFLLLRVRSGEKVESLANWWTKYQQVSPEQQDDMLAQLQSQQRKRRKSVCKKPRQSVTQAKPAE